MGAFDVPEVHKVKRIEDLQAFVHYYHGITRGKNAQIAFFNGFRTFLEKHPEWQGRGIGYPHLARVCEWGVKNNKGRVASTVYLLYWLDEAVKDGVFPEFEETAAQSAEDEFYSILAIEDDPQWRHYLIGTQGKLREQAIAEWRQERET